MDRQEVPEREGLEEEGAEDAYETGEGLLGDHPATVGSRAPRPMHASGASNSQGAGQGVKIDGTRTARAATATITTTTIIITTTTNQNNGDLVCMHLCAVEGAYVVDIDVVLCCVVFFCFCKSECLTTNSEESK